MKTDETDMKDDLRDEYDLTQCGKSMKTDETDMKDDLRDEYDLTQLRVRKVGPGRKGFDGIDVHLDPDVARLFPDSQSVNEALRFLIRISRQSTMA